MNYSRIFGSNFPNSLIKVGTKKDVDDDIADLVVQYYKYLSDGNLGKANDLYRINEEILKPYSINMEDFNLLQEELYNIGLNLLNKTNIIVSEEEPATISDNSFWYQDLGVVE